MWGNPRIRSFVGDMSIPQISRRTAGEKFSRSMFDERSDRRPLQPFGPPVENAVYTEYPAHGKGGLLPLTSLQQVSPDRISYAPLLAAETAKHAAHREPYSITLKRDRRSSTRSACVAHLPGAPLVTQTRFKIVAN